MSGRAPGRRRTRRPTRGARQPGRGPRRATPLHRHRAQTPVAPTHGPCPEARSGTRLRHWRHRARRLVRSFQTATRDSSRSRGLRRTQKPARQRAGSRVRGRAPAERRKPDPDEARDREQERARGDRDGKSPRVSRRPAATAPIGRVDCMLFEGGRIRGRASRVGSGASGSSAPRASARTRASPTRTGSRRARRPPVGGARGAARGRS